MAVLKLTGLDQVFPLESADDGLLIKQEDLVDNRKTTSRKVEPLPTTHPSVASWMKRFLDIVGSVVGLLITGVLFIPIAIRYSINDPGSIFFSQIRCGWMGKRFEIWNFAPCVWMQKRRNPKSKTKCKVHFSRMKMTPELSR